MSLVPDLAKAARANPECRLLLLLADRDARLYRPTRDAFANRIEQMRHRRQHQLEIHALLLQQPQRLANTAM